MAGTGMDRSGTGAEEMRLLRSDIFLLSLFYISTTTRHTLENRRFLEANSNEKFCGTIRETLCECAAPSSMESYIYNIVCLAYVCVPCVIINALSDYVIVYSGFCGCIFLLRVLVYLFIYFILFIILHMIFSCLLSIFVRFAYFVSPFCYLSLSRSYAHSAAGI
jgi:hypothetical protein